MRNFEQLLDLSMPYSGLLHITSYCHFLYPQFTLSAALRNSIERLTSLLNCSPLRVNIEPLKAAIRHNPTVLSQHA